MLILKLIIFFTYWYLHPNSAEAHQPDPKSAWTLNDVVQLALNNSPLITAQQQNVQESESRGKQATSIAHPSLNLFGGYKESNGAAGGFYEINLSQAVSLPGKMALKQHWHNLQKELAEYTLSESKRLIELEVIRLAYAYQIATDKAGHKASRLKRFQLIQSYLQGRPFSSPQKIVQKIIVENKILLMTQTLMQSEAQKENIWTQLNTYINQEQKIMLKTAWFEKPTLMEWKTVLQKTLTYNTVISKAAKEVQQSQTELALAQKETMPDVYMGANYRQEWAQGTDKFAGVFVTFNLPVWHHNQHAVAAQQAQKTSIESKTEYIKHQTVQKLQAAYQEYVTAAQIIRTLNISKMEQIHQQLEFADNEFKKGRVELADYLELESVSHETHEALLDAQYDWVDKYTRLLALMGTDNFLPPSTHKKI